MLIIPFFILHITCLLSAFIPHAYAQQQQHDASDATTTTTTLNDITSSPPSQQKIIIPIIRTLEDLKKFINHGGLPPKNEVHSFGLENDDTTTTTTTFEEEEEEEEAPSLFILFDTTSASASLCTTHNSGSCSAHDSDSSSSSDVDDDDARARAKAKGIKIEIKTVKQAFESFAEKYYYRDRDQDGNEPLRFGIIEIETDNVKTAGGFEEVIAREMGITLGLELGLGTSSALPTVVLCLRCGGVEGRVETFRIVPEFHSEEVGSRGVDEVEEEQLEKWMKEVARPVIGELTKGNYGRVREVRPSYLPYLPFSVPSGWLSSNIGPY